jgi:hypothetical protein
MSFVSPIPSLLVPPFWDDIALIYFRANPETRLYPCSPQDLMIPGRKSELVVAAIGTGDVRQYSINGVPALQDAMRFVLHPLVSGNRRVVTVHARALLGRLARWQAIAEGVPCPQSLKPPALIDIVEAINEPAVLAYASRVSFRISDYQELLGLTPHPGFDEETGLLFNLITRYGR